MRFLLLILFILSILQKSLQQQKESQHQTSLLPPKEFESLNLYIKLAFDVSREELADQWFLDRTLWPHIQLSSPSWLRYQVNGSNYMMQKDYLVEIGDLQFMDPNNHHLLSKLIRSNRQFLEKDPSNFRNVETKLLHEAQFAFGDSWPNPQIRSLVISPHEKDCRGRNDDDLYVLAYFNLEEVLTTNHTIMIGRHRMGKNVATSHLQRVFRTMNFLNEL